MTNAHIISFTQKFRPPLPPYSSEMRAEWDYSLSNIPALVVKWDVVPKY